MPTNLYEGDNFDKTNSHVIPGLISRFHDAKIKKKKILKYGARVKLKRFYMLMI